MRNGFKKITALLMAALMLLAALPAGASGTEQYSNKVLPGISLASIVEPETPVATYVFKKGTEEISRQSVKNGDTLVEPEVTTGPNEKFVGWEPDVTFGTVSGVTETKTITVNAKIETVYHVFFADTTGRVVVTKEGKTGDVITNFDEVTSTASTLIPLAADEGITGWKNEAGEVVMSVVLAQSDVTLKAFIEKGYWITFDSNGGSYVAPHFVPAGSKATAPAEPVNLGYAFEGWYTDSALTQKAVFDAINSDITLYANWTPQQVSYTVIHWWENANDEEYSFHTSETLYGFAGQMTNAVGKQELVAGKNLFGETVNDYAFTAETIDQKQIKGDGSTIVNVYYKRKTYTLHFKETQNSQNDIKTLTKKWGQDISSSEWPTYDNGNTAWKIKDLEGGKSKYLAFSCTMPMLPNDDGLLWKKTGTIKHTATYYVQNLNDDAYQEHHKDVIYTSNEHPTLVPNEEEQYEIKGFTFARVIYQDYYTSGKPKYDGSRFYYTRNSYNVVYYNGTKVDKTQPYKYEADISGAGDYRPANPPDGMEDYEFEGWYVDPSCTVKYAFNNRKMPANDIIVYAKWLPPLYKVTVYDADRITVLKTFEDIPKGTSISEAGMPTDQVTKPQDGEFLGWLDMETEKPFHFETEITKDYSLYAKVGSKEGYSVKYDANGGQNPPTDIGRYSVGSKAVLLPKGEMQAPNATDKAIFLGWAKSPNATTPDYLPGESMEIVAADAVEGVITLYAVWGPAPATTTLTYNANYAGADPATKSHALADGSTVLPNNAKITLYGEGTFARPGYKLVGWANNADATEPDYALGKEVIVDNNLQQGEENVLYAVWEKTTVTLTIKKVVAEGGDTTKEFAFSGSYTESGETTSITSFSLKHNETATLEVPIGAALTITETGAADYTTTATYADNTYTATESAGTQTISGITVDGTNTEITVTNTIKTGTLTISKKVTGGWGERGKLFTFTLTKDGQTLGTVDLSNNGSYTHNVSFPYGTVVTITETDYSGEGYTTTNDHDNGGNTATVTINAVSTTVTFTNNKDANPDTGVLLDSLPYILILAAIAVVVGVVVVRRRRSRDDD